MHSYLVLHLKRHNTPNEFWWCSSTTGSHCMGCFRKVVYNGSSVFGHLVKQTKCQGFGGLICLVFFLGFSLQSYFGIQKSSTMDGTNTQANFKSDDSAHFMPPKIEISGIEAKPAPPRPHKLKPRDMNVLTPSGFWNSSASSLCSSVCRPSSVLTATLYTKNTQHHF